MIRQKFLVTYRFLLVFIVLTGLIFNFIGRNLIETMVFFTIQSNLLALIILSIQGYFLFKGKRMYQEYPILLTIKHIIMMNLIITFLGFHFLLRRTLLDDPSGYLTSVENILLHYLVPILFVFDYLFFDKKRHLSLKSIPLFLIYPYAYLLFVIIRAELGGILLTVNSRYPYFFLDIDTLGFNMIFYVLAMTIFFTFMAFLLFKIDQIFSKT
ncbi:MAG: Pr6Pr family membrane protein [Candidatus Izemoplasmataceae bacterium]